MSRERWRSKSLVSPGTMELPKKMNGEVDWPTLGNILVAYSLGEVVCASFVDTKYGKSEEGLIPATNWQYSFEDKDVVVLEKDLDDCPVKCFMGRSVIDLPPKVIHESLEVNENALNWDKYIVESRLVDQLRNEENIKDGISYMRHEAKQCLVKVKRDFVFYVRSQHMPDTGKCVMSVMSVDYPPCPPIPGVDRGQICQGSGWVLEPYNGDPSRTLVSYIAHTNLAGLPPVLINRVMCRQPLAIHYLSRFLSKPKDPPPQTKSFFSFRHKDSTVSSSSSSAPPTDESHSDDSSPVIPHITPDIPTPDIFRDETGYTFSAVTLGSNPLYNWSIGSNMTTVKDKDSSFNDSDGDNNIFSRDSGGRETKEPPRELEESESILDFKIMSIDGCTDRRVRPSHLWLPSAKNSEAPPIPPPLTMGEGTNISSSESDASSKGQCNRACEIDGLGTRE